MSFAIIKTGGKQYKVSEGDKIKIEKINRTVGEEFDFSDVLLLGNSHPDMVQIGAPLVPNASVKARILNHGKADKKIVFKFTHKTRYKKKKGHRQPYSTVEILKISAQ